ncbi:MAG: tetratricopeptide repeat protein [Blastocatellia bacterium]|nr:tetratricopeptide repeat protein [Blastocatellia bacterium]
MNRRNAIGGLLLLPGALLGMAAAQDAPAAARAAYDAGVAHLKQKRTAAGIASLREAVRLFPDYFDAQFALAVELGRRDDRIEEALGALEQARRLRDRDPRVYFLFGTLMARQRKFAVAELAFREAIDRDPMNPQSYFSRALTLIELAAAAGKGSEKEKAARLDEADRDLNRALILSGRRMFAAYLQLARVREQRGDRRAAAEMLETYLKHQPNDPNAAAIREAIARLRD